MTQAMEDRTSRDRQRTPFRRRLARLVTEVFAPTPLSALVLAVVALRSAASTGEALLWGAVAILFVTVIPFAYIVRGVRRRTLTDHHVRRREQRTLPLLFGIASVVVLLALVVLLGAPHDLIALIVATVAGLAISLLITLFWKISVHAGATAGAFTILAILFGPWFLLFSPLVALIAWSRVELGDHTPAQVIAGTGVGAAVAFTVFTLLR